MMESTVWVVAGTYGYCVLSGLLPFVNAELYLLAASAAAPRHVAIPLVLAATAGQMTAKIAMYGMGRGVLKLPGDRMKRWVTEAEAWAARRPNMGAGVIFVSASTGFPPFYFISIACGMLKAPLPVFVILGFLGRLVRFGVVVLFPQLGKGVLGS